jgi:hypothetical protein
MPENGHKYQTSTRPVFARGGKCFALERSESSNGGLYFRGLRKDFHISEGQPGYWKAAKRLSVAKIDQMPDLVPDLVPRRSGAQLALIINDLLDLFRKILSLPLRGSVYMLYYL